MSKSSNYAGWNWLGAAGRVADERALNCELDRRGQRNNGIPYVPCHVCGKTKAEPFTPSAFDMVVECNVCEAPICDDCGECDMDTVTCPPGRCIWCDGEGHFGSNGCGAEHTRDEADRASHACRSCGVYTRGIDCEEGGICQKCYEDRE